MPPPAPDQSAEAAKAEVKTIVTRLIGNIENPAGMNTGELFDDVIKLDNLGQFEARDPQGVLQPTKPLLFIRDVVGDEREMITKAFSARSKGHMGDQIAEGEDLRLAWLLGIITKESYEQGREKFEVAGSTPQPSADAWVNKTIPPQEELLRLAQTGSFADMMQAFLLAANDMEDGRNRTAELMSDFLARTDIPLVDRERALNNIGRLISTDEEFWNIVQRKVELKAKPAVAEAASAAPRVDTAGESGLVVSAVDRRAGSQEATLFGRGSPFRNERRLNELWDSPIVYSAEYQAGEFPVHLGQWLGEDGVGDKRLIQNFPPAPGQWVQESRSGPVRIMQGWVTEGEKYAYGIPDVKSLSVLRAVLISGNRLFKQDDVARPPRIYGYGMAKSEGYSYERPYLVVESLDPNFKKLDQYLEERGGRLPENEAVEISMKLCKALAKFHDFRVVHGGIFETYDLENLLWNPQTKQLRIEGWDYDKTFPEYFDGVNVAGEIHSMGALLFRLTTGKSWFQTERDIGESLRERYPTDNIARFREQEQQIESLMTTFDPETRKVLQRSLETGEEMKYSEGFLVANSKRMLIDLFRASQILAGRTIDEQAAGYLAEAEKRLIYRNVARAYKEHQSSLYNLPQAYIKYPNHPVPPDRIKEVAEDIEKRKKSNTPMTIDQIIDMAADSYNFNLDKAIELAGINQI